VAAPDLVLAHAVGVRTDLPVPLPAVLAAGAAALLVSFAGLSLLWHRSRLHGERAGRLLPDPAQRLLDSRLLLGLGRAAALLVALAVVGLALLGPARSSENVAPYAFYVTFWVGLVPLSLLLGGVWRAVNPLRTLYAGFARVAGPPYAERALPRLGLWPAAAFLLAYAWVELVLPDRAVPTTLGLLLLGYGVVQLLAAGWYGPGWFAQGDAFEVWSSLLGRFSPLGRRADGRWVLRNPLDGVDGLPAAPGLAAFVLVAVGSTAFDGLTRASWWLSTFSLTGDALLVPTAGLALCVAGTAGLYALATSYAGRSAGIARPAAVFAHSVLPIAAGYAVAHYFSLLVFEGQQTWILASNPLALDGVDLFGTYAHAIDFRVVSPGTVAAVQVAGVVLGHVLGVVLAHDRAVRLAPTRAQARRSQYPLLVVMVAFTVTALRLLLG